MKPLFFYIAIILSGTMASCQKDSSGTKGCTNRYATNYNAAATIDDGTCVSLGSQYDGKFRLSATTFNFGTYHQDTITYIATLARVSPINNIISLAGFLGNPNDTAYFIVNPGGIYFPKMQFTNPQVSIYSSADGTFYGTPFTDPTITLNGDTLTLNYEYQGTTLNVSSASVTGIRIH